MSQDDSFNMLQALDAAEVLDATDIYRHFDKTTLESAVVKATRYVTEVKNLCISCDVKSPLVDSIVEMESFNINMLCKQVFYAMHAIDSIFEKIDAQGGALTDFAMMIKLQNDAQSLVNQYIAYIRSLPQVMTAYANSMRVSQDAQDLGNNANQGQLSQTAASVDAGTESLVTRSIVDVIKTIEKQQDVINTAVANSDFDDDEDLRPMFEPAEEVKELFKDDERYTDEKTYAELMQESGNADAFVKEQEASLSVQSKPTKIQNS